MFGIQHLGVFIAAGLMLNITPGPDTIYILGRTLSQGRAAGVASVLGISSGCVVHTLAAAIGLSLILTRSAVAFTCLKTAGAAYLLYLGVRMLCEKNLDAPLVGSSVPIMRPWAIYRQGLLTNVLNPKVALFFLAFLPQFVVPDASTRWIPFLILGAIFIFNGTLYCLILVTFASAIARRLQRNSKSVNRMKRFTGAAFIALALRLAFERKPAS